MGVQWPLWVACMLLALGVPSSSEEGTCDVPTVTSSTPMKPFLGWQLTCTWPKFNGTSPMVTQQRVLADGVVLVEYGDAFVNQNGCFYGTQCHAAVVDALPHRCEDPFQRGTCPRPTAVQPLPRRWYHQKSTPFLLVGYHHPSFYHFVFEILSCFLVFLEQGLTAGSPPVTPVTVWTFPLPSRARVWWQFLKLPPVVDKMSYRKVYTAAGALATHCPPNPGWASPQMQALRRRVAKVQPQPRGEGPGGGIAVLRREGRREVTNHRAIMHRLQKDFPNVTVRDLFLEKLPLPEALAHLAAAEVIVSPHGAQLSHIALLEHPNVLELLPESWAAGTNQKLACNYVALVVRGVGYADAMAVQEALVSQGVRLLWNVTRNHTAMRQCLVQLRWMTNNGTQ
eukprot:EG_transcript_12729